jgi:hypothetical protein
MKDILARGGIEILAILMGISASLWIDNNNKEEDLALQRQQTYQLLKNKTDSLLSYTNKMLDYYEIQGMHVALIIDQWESIQPQKGRDQCQIGGVCGDAYSRREPPDERQLLEQHDERGGDQLERGPAQALGRGLRHDGFGGWSGDRPSQAAGRCRDRRARATREFPWWTQCPSRDILRFAHSGIEQMS